MKGKRLRALALCLAALLLSGCGRSAAPEDGTDAVPVGELSGHLLEQPQAADSLFSVNYDPEGGLNPILAKSGVNMLFSSLLYDSVFTVDESWNAHSEIVTEYTTTDNIWWVFRVDTSIPMTDGSTLTARDVAYSIQRAQQSSYYSRRLSVIYGCSALDDGSFAITTKYADSLLPALLTVPVIKYGSAGEDVPPGSGAYRLSEEGDRLVLFPENRHAGEMPVSEIYLKSYLDAAEKISAFETAELDIVVNDLTGSQALGYGNFNEKRYYNTSNLQYLGFNMSSTFFQSGLCRLALQYLVDRDAVVERMSSCGLAAALPVPPESGLYDESYAASFAYDPAKAAGVFFNANVRDHDNDGVLEFLVTGIVVEIDIDFIVNTDSAVKVQAARQIAAALNDLGIKTTLRELSWNDYKKALADGKYDMYYGEIRLTPDWNLACLFEDEGLAMNYARCRDTSYADLYYAYLAAGEAERYDKYQEAVRYLMENGGIVPVCFERRQVLTHRDVVSGMHPTQYDVFHLFTEWTIHLT